MLYDVWYILKKGDIEYGISKVCKRPGNHRVLITYYHYYPFCFNYCQTFWARYKQFRSGLVTKRIKHDTENTFICK